MTPSKSLTRAQVREVDRIAVERYGIGGLVLMENAGLLATLEILPLLEERPGPVVVLCGGGNNGGDGYVIARQLALRGRDVRLISTREPGDLGGDCALQRSIVDAMGLAVTTVTSAREVEAAGEEWGGAALAVDALLGTGFQGEVRAPLSDLVAALERAHSQGLPVVSIDLPSGLDCDEGTPSNATVRADLTLTFVARKRGFDQPASRAYTGEVRVLPIGAPCDPEDPHPH